MSFDIIIPTMWKGNWVANSLQSLSTIPFSYRLHIISGAGEGEAQGSFVENVNEGLKRSKGDVILMNDDIVIMPETFHNYRHIFDLYDIVGFQLIGERGEIAHSGGCTGKGTMLNKTVDTMFLHRHTPITKHESQYHITYALVKISKKVIDAIGFLDPLYLHNFNDVEYNFRALKAGFTVGVVPNRAIHIGTGHQTAKREFCYSCPRCNRDIFQQGTICPYCRQENIEVPLVDRNREKKAKIAFATEWGWGKLHQEYPEYIEAMRVN